MKRIAEVREKKWMTSIEDLDRFVILIVPNNLMFLTLLFSTPFGRVCMKKLLRKNYVQF